MPLLEINRLQFAYPGKTLFNDFNLTLQENQVVGLLGLNGQGKSTLLKLLAGVLPFPASVVRKTADKGLTTGFMPERPLFYPELAARDNITFAGRMQGLSGDELEQAVDDALRRSCLQERASQLAGHLSKGFQQRLGLAMAIVHRPRLLLLDEPIDGMDPGQVRETHALISELSADTAILISSHRVFEISELCQRVLFLHDGEIRHDLQLSDDISQERLAALFEQVTGSAESAA